MDLRRIQPCADDPVSRDAVSVFQPKIGSIMATHHAYLTELFRARDALEAAAVGYGLVEADNVAALRSTAVPAQPTVDR